MSSEELKEYAKQLYFSTVKVEEWRKEFEDYLKKVPVKDYRYKGFFCCQCKRFSNDERMTFALEEVRYHRVDNKIVEIWIVKPHYDGCRGWN